MDQHLDFNHHFAPHHSSLPLLISSYSLSKSSSPPSSIISPFTFFIPCLTFLGKLPKNHFLPSYTFSSLSSLMMMGFSYSWSSCTRYWTGSADDPGNSGPGCGCSPCWVITSFGNLQSCMYKTTNVVRACRTGLKRSTQWWDLDCLPPLKKCLRVGCWHTRVLGIDPGF